MTPEALATAHTQVIRRHWRDLGDHGGQPTQRMLDDLAQVVDAETAEARQVNEALLDLLDDIFTELGDAVKPGWRTRAGLEQLAATPEPKPAPRRTTRRTTAK